MEKAYFYIFLVVLSALVFVHITNPTPLLPGALTVILFLSAFICLCYRNLRFVFLLLAFSFASLYATGFLNQKNLYEDLAKTGIPEGRYLTLVGQVVRFPVIRSDSSVFILRSESYEYGRKRIPVSFRIRIRIRGNLSRLIPGQRVRINCRLSPPEFPANFYKTGYSHHPLYRDYHFRGYAKSPRMARPLNRGPFICRIIGEWRNRVRSIIESHFSTAPNSHLSSGGVFLQAILLGDRGKMERKEKEKMLNAGIYHLVAISGTHIAIITLCSLFLFRMLGMNYKYSHLFTGLLLCLFLAATGFQVSALRAALVALLIMIGRCYFLDFHPLNLIGMSGLIILYLNPAQFLDPGFILTFFLAMTIILGRRILLPVFRRIWRPARELLSANLSAFLMAIPLSLFFFRSASLMAPVSGLLLIPVTAVITALGLVLMIGGPIFQGVSGFLVLLLNPVFSVFFGTLDFLQQFSRLRIYRGTPFLGYIITIFLAIYMINRTDRKSLKIVGTAVLCTGFLICVLRGPAYQPDGLETYFLDVGSGDASVVVFRTGDGLLIDGGGYPNSDYPVGREIVLPFILEKNINVRWFAFSHYHPDHARGLIELLPILRPEEIWLSSAALQNDLYRDLRRRCRGIRLIPVDRTFYREVGEGSVRCLHPPTFITSAFTKNNHSQVLSVADPRLTVLFTGDIESEVEAQLLKNHPHRLAARVLKVPHHGSGSSSTPGFLRAVNPCLAVVSCGRNSIHRFPHPQVVENYRKLGVRLLSTAESGAVRVTHDPCGNLLISTGISLRQ